MRSVFSWLFLIILVFSLLCYLRNTRVKEIVPVHYIISTLVITIVLFKCYAIHFIQSYTPQQHLYGILVWDGPRSSQVIPKDNHILDKFMKISRSYNPLFIEIQEIKPHQSLLFQISLDCYSKVIQELFEFNNYKKNKLIYLIIGILID